MITGNKIRQCIKTQISPKIILLKILQRSHYFHKMILKTLPMAYQLLKRDLYGDILKAHLADRRKTLCDRLDIEPESNSGIGPQIGTYRVIEGTRFNRSILIII